MSALWRRLAGGCCVSRPALLLAGLLLVLGLALPAEVRGQSLGPLDPEETELLRLVNLERQRLELPLLRREARLEGAMTLHVEWMARSRILSHTGQAGSSPFQRAMAQGYEPGALGEVIARGQRTAQDVLLGRRCDWTCNTVCDASQRCGGWRQSPPHWAIITDGRYRDLGLSRVSASSGGQTYWGMLLGLDPLSAQALAPTATVAAATATATTAATSSATRAPSATLPAPATATGAPSATASRSPTSAPSPTASGTPSPRQSATASPAPSASRTPSPAVTATPTRTPSPLPSATPSRTTATLTRTPSATPPPSATSTPTRTPTPSPSSTPTRTPTPSSTPTTTRTVTPSPTRTASRTPTASPSTVPSATATRTAVPTASRTATTSPSATASVGPSASATLARPSATASVTARPSATPAPSGELQGEVHVQGRGACSGTLILVDGGLGDVTGADCRFSLRGLRPGAHRVEAWRQGWLSRERQVEVGGPQTLTLPAIWLPAGDLTGDDWVDVQDLMMADLARGSCRGQAGWEALADVDGNGCVDLSDRIWVEMNQGLAGPLAW